jgi:hypothetical protein
MLLLLLARCPAHTISAAHLLRRPVSHGRWSLLWLPACCGLLREHSTRTRPAAPVADSPRAAYTGWWGVRACVCVYGVVRGGGVCDWMCCRMG